MAEASASYAPAVLLKQLDAERRKNKTQLELLTQKEAEYKQTLAQKEQESRNRTIFIVAATVVIGLSSTLVYSYAPEISNGLNAMANNLNTQCRNATTYVENRMINTRATN